MFKFQRKSLKSSASRKKSNKSQNGRSSHLFSMARRSSVSTKASNGSISDPVHELDTIEDASSTTEGTLKEECLDDYEVNQHGQPTQDTRPHYGNQSLQENQVYLPVQGVQGDAPANQNYPDPSESLSPRPLERFLNESDAREEFRSRVYAPVMVDREGREGSISLSENPYGGFNEILRSNTIKEDENGSGKEARGAEWAEADDAENTTDSSPMKRERRGKHRSRSKGKKR